MAGRRAKEWVRGGRQKKVADRKKAFWPGVGPRSPVVVPLYKKFGFFFLILGVFLSLEQELWTQVLEACSPLLSPLLPWDCGVTQGTAGESMHGPSGLLAHYSPCPWCPKPPWSWRGSCHAFVISLLASSDTGSLLGRGCRPCTPGREVLQPLLHGVAAAAIIAARRLPPPLPQPLQSLPWVSAMQLAGWGFQPTLR
jgi:hypothetical protein